MEVVFTFSGTAEAIKGEAALEEGGLSVKVMPRPPALGAGCGLCLRLPAAEAAAGLKLLTAAGLEAQGLYDRLEACGAINYRPRARAGQDGPPT